MDEPIDDLLSHGRDEEVKARIEQMLLQPAQTTMPPEVAAGVLEAIVASDRTPVVEMQKSRNWRIIAACAAIVILALGVGYFWFNTARVSNKENQPGKLAAKAIKDIQPGGNKAMLTLADGSVIDLDSINSGTIATQGKIIVKKKEDGQIEYEGSHSPLTTHNSPAFNTVTTPNGGQYQIVLPDGSRVWLNAASSIRFPTSFTGTQREVTVTGEVYFEVAHNANMPFIVTIPPLPGGPGAAVEVLGTHFNINSYGDDGNIMTTLLEGSVKVGNRQWAVGSGEKANGRGQRAEGREGFVMLKPGEQAILSQSSQTSQVIPVQTAEVIAWKNGLFNLAGADLKDLMHQVERWYDVRVRYEGIVPDMEFQGKLNRAVPLSDIIDYLKNLGVECTLVGKTLLVKSK